MDPNTFNANSVKVMAAYDAAFTVYLVPCRYGVLAFRRCGRDDHEVVRGEGERAMLALPVYLCDRFRRAVCAGNSVVTSGVLMRENSPPVAYPLSLLREASSLFLRKTQVLRQRMDQHDRLPLTVHTRTERTGIPL